MIEIRFYFADTKAFAALPYSSPEAIQGLIEQYGVPSKIVVETDSGIHTYLEDESLYKEVE
jgi:hypothetical protein